MASTSFTIVINSQPAVAVDYQPPTDLTAPVVSGKDLGPIVVTPADWSGSLALSGADAAKFAITVLADGPHLMAASALLSGTFTGTITATP